MTSKAPAIMLDVDLRNPGQFFASCAVLEIASRLWPATAENNWAEPEGWFDDGLFCVTAGRAPQSVSIEAIARGLSEAKPLVRSASDAGAFGDQKIAPLAFALGGVRLDWWLESPQSVESGIFKLWSGQQNPLAIFEYLQREFCGLGITADRRLLRVRCPMTGRFGFDPGPAWDPVDVGFSPNEQGIAVLTSPATEILAAVGLQTFRPKRTSRRRIFCYTAWTEPMPAIVARVAASGVFGGRRFQFAVNRRGQYKAFGFAEEMEETE